MILSSISLVVLLGVTVAGLSEVNVQESKDLRKNCLCHELFELLVDARAQWKVDMRKVSELEKKVEKLEKNPQLPWRKGKSCKYPIAYFARRNTNTLVAGGKTVDFKDVVTDPCNSFNSSTSVFTCTIPGVYVFHLMVMDQADNRLNHLFLMKNDKPEAYTWSRGNGRHEMAGNTVILNLLTGDRVYVKADKSYPSQPYTIYSTFSGFMLY